MVHFKVKWKKWHSWHPSQHYGLTQDRKVKILGCPTKSRRGCHPNQMCVYCIVIKDTSSIDVSVAIVLKNLHTHVHTHTPLYGYFLAELWFASCWLYFPGPFFIQTFRWALYCDLNIVELRRTVTVYSS